MLETNINEALARELDRLTDEIRGPLGTLAETDVDSGAIAAASALARSVVGRFTDMADFCDMPALRRLGSMVGRHFEAYPGLPADRRVPLATNDVLRQWSGLLAGYLRNPGQADGLVLLLDRFQEADWPDRLDADEAVALRRDLDRECVEGASSRSAIDLGVSALTADDVRIAFAEDINPQLADTFLAEAPERLARLGECLRRLVGPEASAEDASRAQRLAHTIKGSANITGVRGLANMVHWVESILEHLPGDLASAPGELLALLLETTDCLESMLECLAAGEAAPEEALGILERLCLWEVRVRRGVAAREPAAPSTGAAPLSAAFDAPGEAASGGPVAAPDVGATPDSAPASETSPESPAPERAAPVSPAAPETTPVMRVAVGSIDRMLRLAGELATELVQMRGHLANAMLRTGNQRDHEQLLQQRLIALQDLSDVRGIPAAQRVLADGSANEEFDPLELDQYNELHSVVNAFTESLTDFGELNSGLTDDLKFLDRILVRQEQMSKELNDIIVGVRTVEAQSIVPRLARCVRQTCRSTGKGARLEVDGADLSVDSDMLGRLVDPLMHMLRNAVDHGIESRPERVAAEKPEDGVVRVQFAREGESIVVRCHDDGAGYDLERIRASAVERGLVDPDQAISDEDTVQLTFVPGFSTSSTVTHVSGRGIGLDVVRKTVQDLRGSLDVTFERGRGTTVTLRLPLTLISMHLLLVRGHGQIFGVPSRMLRQSLYASAGQFRRGDQGEWIYAFDEEDFQVMTLDRLLGHRNVAFDPGDRALIPVLLLEGDHEPAAVVVDEAVDSRYVAVQRLGDYVPRVKAVVGATVLRDGAVAPVIDIGELVRRPAQDSPRALPRLRGAQPPAEAPAVLIVDDSLSARRSMSEIIEDAGYRVRTAVDGLDAIDAIERELPVVVVLDLEMPNMNGLELAAHLRNSQRTNALPLLMVTSRSTSKHHEQAYVAGVDGIITKPWQDDDLVRAVNVAVASRLVAAEDNPDSLLSARED